MYLDSLSLQGFKSFATKTVLKFLPPNEESHGITAIVGPNGSGKSNCVDALRWVMGEQSVKTLRGKKTEDVIFAGSNKKQRAGFAEVTLSLKNEKIKTEEKKDKENDDNLNLEGIEITRRAYRDGTSEYFMGKNRVRLSDVQLLLAKLGIGTKSYGIIGQGMIDSILIMNDAEKREFFDEATGVKQYQIKKNQAILQLKNATSNLRQALTVLQEIEPRLRYLKKQIHRLEEKEEVEAELHSLQHIYYGSLYHDLIKKIEQEKNKISESVKEIEVKEKEIQFLEKKLKGTSYLQPTSITNLQTRYQKLLEEKSKLKEKELELKNKIWQLSQNAKKSNLPSINLIKLVSDIENLEKLEQEIANLLKNENCDLKAVALKLNDLLTQTRLVIKSLKNNDADENTKEEEKQLENLKNQIEILENQIEETRKEMESIYKKEEESKKDFINLQKELREKQDAIHLLENQLNNFKIELARLETKKEALEKEMNEELKERIERVKNEPICPEGPDKSYSCNEPLDEIYSKIQKLKYRAALAGEIDEGVVKEYNETNERYTFLKNQTEDLKKSIANLKGVILELDQMIESQFSKSFERINEAFNRYFKILFCGGNATIVKKKILSSDSEGPAPTDQKGHTYRQKDTSDLNPALNTNEEWQTLENEQEKYSIEIHVNLPRKKIKSLEMLSGGEKALTVIALICGIIYCNPSPFIILDEVDAALDETNSIKFAEILKELSRRSQFIVITHNRATMENASLLYGVTMGDDGVSKILSVDLRAAKNMAK